MRKTPSNHFSFKVDKEIASAISAIARATNRHITKVCEEMLARGIRDLNYDQEKLLNEQKKAFSEMEKAIRVAQEKTNAKLKSLSEELVSSGEESLKDLTTQSAIPAPIAQAAKPKRTSRRTKDC